MKLTRKELLVGGAAGAALGAAGIYELVDKLADSSPSHRRGRSEPEQHLLDGMRVERQEGVEVVVPLRHHEVVTAKVVAPRISCAMRAPRWPQCCRSSTTTIPHAGRARDHRRLGPPVLPDARPEAADLHLPFDRARRSRALLDAVRFPSDPEDTLLEDNDVAFLFRSDNEENIRRPRPRSSTG
jgi:hypothetical protein